MPRPLRGQSKRVTFRVSFQNIWRHQAAEHGSTWQSGRSANCLRQQYLAEDSSTRQKSEERDPRLPASQPDFARSRQMIECSRPCARKQPGLETERVTPRVSFKKSEGFPSFSQSWPGGKCHSKMSLSPTVVSLQGDRLDTLPRRFRPTRALYGHIENLAHGSRQRLRRERLLEKCDTRRQHAVVDDRVVGVARDVEHLQLWTLFGQAQGE